MSLPERKFLASFTRGCASQHRWLQPCQVCNLTYRLEDKLNMSKTLLISILATAVSVTLTGHLWADCPLAHTHIGKNPTWQPVDWGDPGGAFTDPDPTDDNKLWFFSLPPVHPVAPTPGWPQWGEPANDPFLLLVPEFHPWGDPVEKPGDPSKHRYTCSFKWSQDSGYGDPNGMQHLDGWHSAHGPQGAWNLEAGDPNNAPAWDIGIKREFTSLADPTDFLMMTPNDTHVLTTDGSTWKFTEANHEKLWLEEESAWGIHSHMSFHFYLPDGMLGQEVSATFSAFDDGGLYTPSDNFEFRFLVTPEPGSLALLLIGALIVRRRRR